MAASVFPDWDILPGLLAGYEAVQFHRGATHSPVGVILQSLAMAPVGRGLWTWLRESFPRLHLSAAPAFWPMVLVLVAGMGLHALVDALNPWGVAPLWPLSRDGAGWNLVHEGDRVFLFGAVLCAVVAAWGGARTIAVFTSACMAAVMVWKADHRAEAVAIARRELGAGRVAVYPNPSAGCPWSALSDDGGGSLRAACIDPRRPDPLRVVRTVSPPRSPLVERSKSDPSVVDFLHKRAFPFAEVEPTPDGGAVVLWRDLRESLLESPSDPRFGLEVRFDREGEIVSIEHRWMLKVSF